MQFESEIFVCMSDRQAGKQPAFRLEVRPAERAGWMADKAESRVGKASLIRKYGRKLLRRITYVARECILV